MSFVSMEFWIITVMILVALNGALIGSFLVLRGMAMMTDAMSHAVLFGLVVAILLSGSLFSPYLLIGGAFSCLLTAYLSQYLRDHGRVQEDASLGIVFTWLFAMGVILISLFAKQIDIDQDCVLHGEIVLVPFDTLSLFGSDIGPKAFWELLVVLVFNLALLFYGKRGLQSLAFDEVHATLNGLHPKLWNFLLLFSASMTSVASFDAVGVILIVSLIVTPAASAYLFARSIGQMILLAVAYGVSAVLIGYYIAAQYDASISAAAGMMSGILFLVSFIFHLVIHSSGSLAEGKS